MTICLDKLSVGRSYSKGWWHNLTCLSGQGTLGTRGFSHVRRESSVSAEGRHVLTETGNRARKVSGNQGKVRAIPFNIHNPPPPFPRFPHGRDFLRGALKVISEGDDYVSTFGLWNISNRYVVWNVIRLHPLTVGGCGVGWLSTRQGVRGWRRIAF